VLHLVDEGRTNAEIAATLRHPGVVQVLDPYDNPVAGQTVNFVKLPGPGSIPASATTNASGNAQQTLTTGTTVGVNAVKATILDENPAALERVDFTISTMAGAIANYLVTPSKTNPLAHEDVTITVTGRDANNNPRTQDVSTNITLLKTGSAVLAASTGTLLNGVFTTTVHDDVAESFTVSAQTQGNPAQNGTSPSIVASNGPAYQVFKVSGDGSGLIAGATQPLTVVVKDVYGNAVANQVVTFAIASAPGPASITDTTGDPSDGITITDGGGQATVTYQSALAAGTNSINAQILDGTPLAQERVTFTVTTTAGGIAYYTVQMNATSTTAGVSKNVTVTAYDNNNNQVDDDVTQVDLSPSPGVGLVFGQDPVNGSKHGVELRHEAVVVVLGGVGGAAEADRAVVDLAVDDHLTAVVERDPETPGAVRDAELLGPQRGAVGTRQLGHEHGVAPRRQRGRIGRGGERQRAHEVPRDTDVAGGAGGKRAAAKAAERAVENARAGIECGGRIGNAHAPCVVEVDTDWLRA
jgi:hypothetical protein